MQREVTRTTLAVLSIGGLLAASFWIMRPFLVALVWATMIVVATWSPMRSLQRRLGGRRSLATAAMVTAMLLVFVLPFWLAHWPCGPAVQRWPQHLCTRNCRLQ